MKTNCGEGMKKSEEGPVLPTLHAPRHVRRRLIGNALAKIAKPSRKDTFLTESLILNFLFYELWEKGYFSGRGFAMP